MTEERIPIIRVEASGRETEGTARMRGGTIDDFRSNAGLPLDLPAGASFTIPVSVMEAVVKKEQLRGILRRGHA